MTSAILNRGTPVTEEEFFTLGKTSKRVELFDGGLYITPAPTPRHQVISRRLANLLDPGAAEAGLNVVEAINVRLQPGRIPIPDLVVTTLVEGHYRERSVTELGEVLHLTEPLVAHIAPGELLPPPRT